MKDEDISVSLGPAYGSEEGDTKSVGSDDALLMSMGKKPELKRVYNFWTLCAYQIMISCSWSCLVVLYSTIFDIGGPFALVWGTLFVAVGQTLLMLSLAELCSIWPTAGGQQYYTQALATAKYRPFLSYVVGWAVLVGEISTGSSCALNSAQIIASFVEITHPEYDWKPWLTWLTYSLFLVMPVVVNLAPRYLPALNIFGAVWTIVGGLAWAISFGVMAPKHNSDFVFKLFINNSGYTSSGWVFILSFYTPMYGLYGTDGMMHLVEEMKDASKQAPRVMVWSMIFCSITSWLGAILMMWTAGNWESYMLASQPCKFARPEIYCLIFNILSPRTTQVSMTFAIRRRRLRPLTELRSNLANMICRYELVDGCIEVCLRRWRFLRARDDRSELLHHRGNESRWLASGVVDGQGQSLPLLRLPGRGQQALWYPVASNACNRGDRPDHRPDRLSQRSCIRVDHQRRWRYSPGRICDSCHHLARAWEACSTTPSEFRSGQMGVFHQYCFGVLVFDHYCYVLVSNGKSHA
jgi:hypothetical protein